MKAPSHEAIILTAVVFRTFDSQMRRKFDVFRARGIRADDQGRADSYHLAEGSMTRAIADKPAPVREVELGAKDSVERAWLKLKSRPKLGEADLDLMIGAMRADRERWIIGERKKREKKAAANLDAPIGD